MYIKTKDGTEINVSTREMKVLNIKTNEKIGELINIVIKNSPKTDDKPIGFKVNKEE
jgi:hypothetical protein